MWQYLTEPHKSVAIASLVGDAWGKRSYLEIVASAQRSIVLSIVDANAFVALAQITPIYSSSAWLNVWLTTTWHRQRSRYAQVATIWEELHKYIFVRLAIQTLIAITRERSIARLGQRYGATHTQRVANYFGASRDGYFIIWD